MEDVVLEGTGKPAQLDGYTAAGKSGTAQKIDPATGRYSATEYNSSFVGFAPVNKPAISILVVLDSPVGPHHGGEVGGPVFKRVAEQVLAYLHAPHDVPSPSDVETAKNLGRCLDSGSQMRESADSARRVSKRLSRHNRPAASATTVAFGDQNAIVVPNLAGQSVRGVTEECLRLGLDAIAHRQWRRNRAVPGGGVAGATRKPGYGEVRASGRVRSNIDPRGWELSLTIKQERRRIASDRSGKARPLKLQRLLAGAEIGKIVGPGDVEIQSVAYDSRKVTPGAIFFALRGEKLDGVEFVGDALRRGAAAVASENPSEKADPKIPHGSSCFRVPTDADWRESPRIFTGIRATACSWWASRARMGRRRRRFLWTRLCVRRADKRAGGHNGIPHSARQPRGFEYDTRVSRPAADVRRNPRCRGHARCARGEFTRIGHGAAVGMPLRGRDLHKPDARSSRLSQNFRGVFCREEVALRRHWRGSAGRGGD